MKTYSDSVSFSLVKVNKALCNDETRYRARVKSNGTLTLTDVCQAMVDKVPQNGGLSTCRFYVDLFESTVRDLTRQGYRVKTDLIETGLSISGTFDSVDAEFDAKCHEMRPTVCATKSFKAAVAAVAPKNSIGHLSKSLIYSLMDAVTKRLNEIVLGHEIHVQGINLEIDPNNIDEGVYLDDATGSCIAKATVMNSDKQTVTCRFDGSVPAGSYTMRVVCRCGASPAFRPAEARLPNVIVRIQ